MKHLIIKKFAIFSHFSEYVEIKEGDESEPGSEADEVTTSPKKSVQIKD